MGTPNDTMKIMKIPKSIFGCKCIDCHMIFGVRDMQEI